MLGDSDSDNEEQAGGLNNGDMVAFAVSDTHSATSLLHSSDIINHRLFSPELCLPVRKRSHEAGTLHKAAAPAVF